MIGQVTVVLVIRNTGSAARKRAGRMAPGAVAQRVGMFSSTKACQVEMRTTGQQLEEVIGAGADVLHYEHLGQPSGHLGVRELDCTYLDVDESNVCGDHGGTDF